MIEQESYDSSVTCPKCHRPIESNELSYTNKCRTCGHIFYETKNK